MKKADKIVFGFCVALSLSTIVYCLGSEMLSSAQIITEEANPISSFANANKGAEDIIVSLADFASDNLGRLKIGSDASTSSPSDTYDDKGTLLRVLDADTYIIVIGDAETTVSLIGVDAPDSALPQRSGDTADRGTDITSIVKDYLKFGDTLYLKYDVGRTDTDNNTLAYVFFDNGIMVQDWLLSNGYAQAVDVEPNTVYSAHFAALEQQAKDKALGLWASHETE